MIDKIQYLLAKASEESGEIVQIASKNICFGVNEVYPKIGRANAVRLKEEFNDLVAVMEMLHDEGIFEGDLIDSALIEQKKAKVEKFMEYSRECRVLKPETPTSQK